MVAEMHLPTRGEVASATQRRETMNTTNEPFDAKLLHKLWVAALTGARDLEAQRYRIKRGLVSALDRGGMIGKAPFGLRTKRNFCDDGRPAGITWEIDPVTAPIVQEMYRMRGLGLSTVQIASALNDKSTRTRMSRDDQMRTWRPATVRALLRNEIFKGRFVFNGSSSTKARTKKEDRTAHEITYERPECRLVSDEAWARANSVGCD